MEEKLPVPEVFLGTWISSNERQVTERDDVNGWIDEPEEQWMTGWRKLKFVSLKFELSESF